jgi:hypothetical protein
MSSREFAEWAAYYQVEPFGEARADLRAAIVAKTMADLWRGEGEPVPIENFLPLLQEPPDEEDEEQVEAYQQYLQVVEMLNVAWGGKDLRGQR